MDPNSFSPHGSCNFSRLDSVNLLLELNQNVLNDLSNNKKNRSKSVNINVYAISHRLKEF